MSEDRTDGAADRAAQDAAGSDAPTDAVQGAGAGASTRRMLMLGAAGASMVVTIRPALAQTATSVLTCQIPVPQPRQSGGWLMADGTVVPPYTRNAVRPPSQPLKGQEIREALLQGRLYPGTTREQTQAYTAYMLRLQNGQSGFTCFVSIRAK
ncbi:hypothetical protein [Sphingomonas prati]|uniref:Uncharacterized protein n=1 Tax=Sphingomonas prati TaxID=1843237 RepID=A0A7W9BTZ5_9SPHN|nr:hypothetical protein [Sphingomonas prati]MBB5730087.1 hypothetical protein [Sphingomonas prati]